MPLLSRLLGRIRRLLWVGRLHPAASPSREASREPRSVPASADVSADPTNPLDVLCRRYGGTYERSRHADGRIFLVFKFGEGGLDQIAVAAPSTAEAITLLEERLAKWHV